MNILILHGPNLNLIGVSSAQIGERVTLDKIDTALKRKAKELNVVLKTYQTHYSGKAITFLQRNRNWADGLLFSPGPWALSQYDILDTLKLVKLPVMEIYFTGDFSVDRYIKDSIFKEIVVATKQGSPLEIYPTALTDLYKYISSGHST